MSDEPDEPPPEAIRMRLAIVIGGTLLLLGGSFAVMAAFYRWQAPHRSFEPPREFPAPTILSDQALERERLQAAQRERLEAPGAKQSAGESAAIPIETAMELIAGRGVAAYSPIETEQIRPGAPGHVAENATRSKRGDARRHRKRSHGRRR
jgi:hypothetical protein